MNSRSLVKIQWAIIVILIIAYYLKDGDCPTVEIPPPTRHVEVVKGGDTTKTNVVPTKRKVYKKYKDFLNAPAANITANDSLPLDSGYVYSANVIDSNVSIYVDIPVISGNIDSILIKYNTSLPDKVIITDSIPYPVYVPISPRQWFIGAFLNASAEVTAGAQIGLNRRNKMYVYGYDPFEKTHRVGIFWGIK